MLRCRLLIISYPQCLRTVHPAEGSFPMQAIVFPQAETISVERVDHPACAPDEVIVQVAQCGICGTDVHIYHNEYMSISPLFRGHEFAGSVVEVGSAARADSTGDRVAVDPNLYCGECDFC